MSRCWNGGSPIYDGLADVAVRSAGIARLGAGRGLIVHRMRGMDMSAVPGCLIGLAFVGLYHELLSCPGLGIAMELFSAKGICIAVYKRYIALLNANLNGSPPVLVAIFKLGISILIAFRKHLAASTNLTANIVELPNADRDGNKRLLTDQRSLAVLCNRKMQYLVGSIISICSLKAVRDDHVLKLPLVHAVEVQGSGHRLNILDIFGHDIHIIERTEKNAIQRFVMRNHLHRAYITCRDIYSTDHRGIVPLLIADRELYGMLA